MLTMKPIAYIETDFKDKFGIPRQSGRVPSLRGRIVFLPPYGTPDAFREIEGFSHLWLLFDFSRSHRNTWSPTVRPPRLGGNRRVGVFASRSPFRPNPIGLSLVELISKEETASGTVLHVGGVDLLDKTPIYDIKPYVPHADCRPDAVGGYADEKAAYHLSVSFPPALLARIPTEKQAALLACLAEDPRPSYQADPARVYGMQFAGFDIRFRVEGTHLTVLAVLTI